MRRTQRVLILLTVLIGAQLAAEEIQLKDRTKITGTLVSISGETFGAKTAYGDIKVPRSEVVSITFPENQPKNADEKTAGRVPPIDESLDGTEYRNRTKSFSDDSADGRDACARTQPK